jgi:NAD(P)-dependent dehydrogenase (short-subunit alcohol dehydrogenase family)
MDTNNKGAVVITGASTGIGEACALHLDRLGFQVFAGIRQEADAARLRAQASQRLVPVFMDVTDAASIATAVTTITTILSPNKLIGLVNNAGVAVTAPLEFVPIDKLRWQFEVNVIGQIAVTQAFLALLRQGNGRIINMSSAGGRLAAPFNGPYNGSKFALEAMSDALRMELQSFGLHVAVIEPGSIATPIWEKSLDSDNRSWQEMPPQAHELYGEAMATATEQIARVGQRGIPPQSVADVVLQALTDPAPKTRYLVGQDAVQMAALAKIVPDRARDKILTSQLGLPPANYAAPPTGSTLKLLTGLLAGLAFVGWLWRRK